MAGTLIENSPVQQPPATFGWSPAAALRALLRSRRESLSIARRARRQRIELGYGHIPQRLWDRRSALFVER
ncbi:MAG: hypothetical protein PVJ83_03420 [Gammaproteobacteria bacterium]|jgi:hypothetical protein